MATSKDTLQTLVEPVLEHVVPILEETLSTCAERHSLGEGRGADGFSFGTDAWSFPARRFKELAEQRAVPFDVVNDDGCLLLFGDLRVRHHRVGESEHDDIEVSFPRNAKAASRETSQQLVLPFFGCSSEDVESDTVILAYMANSTDGLCAVYLATIGKLLNGKIRGWAQTALVWTRSDAPSSQLTTFDDALPETVPELILRRGPRKTKADEQR